MTQTPSRIVDVLHLEADKRKDREWSNNIDPETLRPPRTSKQPPSLIELKRFQEQLSKRSPCQREQRRATEDDLVKHNEEMRNRVAPVVVTRHVLKIETHPKRSFVRPAVGGQAVKLYHPLVEVHLGTASGARVAPIDIVTAVVAGQSEFGMIPGTWKVQCVLAAGPWVEIIYAPAPGEQPEEGKHFKCFEDRNWLPDKVVPADGCYHCDETRMGTAGPFWIAVKGTNGTESIEEEVLPPLENVD